MIFKEGIGEVLDPIRLGHILATRPHNLEVAEDIDKEEEKSQSLLKKYGVRYFWSVRGDASFWNEINKRIKGREINSEQELENFIKELFKELTGEEMLEGTYAFCKNFKSEEAVGMSRGVISGDFWLGEDGAIHKLAEHFNLKLK